MPNLRGLKIRKEGGENKTQRYYLPDTKKKRGGQAPTIPVGLPILNIRVG